MRRLALLAALACAEPITYHEDLAPLLARECVGCHEVDGIAPFALEDFASVRDLAPAIAAATANRSMPPFGVDASGDCQSFREDRWLSADEIALFARFADEGRAEGTPIARAAPVAPRFEPTVVLDMGTTYTASAADDYRCFLVDPGLDREMFVNAFEVRPGEPRVVHHVILYTVDSERAEALADRLAAADPTPGYTCFGSSLLPPGDSRMIAGWAPGTPITRYPDGAGIRLAPGRRLVMQVHYNTRQGRLPDRTTVALALAAIAERRAEILPLADLSLSVPAGQALVATEPIAIALPGIGGFVRAVFPHMHELGVSLEARILHADGSSTCLARVPRWDFGWQQMYAFERAPYVLGTDRIELRCRYDTRARREPVRWGEGTTDEMCLLGLLVTLD